MPRQAAIARLGRICCSGNFCAESTTCSISDWPCLRRKAGGRQVTRASVPLSNHPKTPARSPAHATILHMETGSRKATHKVRDLSGVGLVALGPPSSNRRRAFDSRTPLQLIFADSPTGCGNRTVNPDELRSSRRSAANLATDATGVAARLPTW